VIVAAALVDARLAPAPAALTVDRSLPAALTIGGDTGEVSWRIANPTARPQSVAIADELAPSLHPSRRRARVRIPPGGTAVATASLQPARRGRFEPTELVVRVAGPLGLAQRQRRRALPGVLRVLPPFRSRQEAELRIQRARLDIGLRSARGRGGGTEFDALREYGVDDESRRIDWAATARALKPIVRTYRAERNQHVIALLDNGRLMAGQVEGIPRLEWGMDAVMMLTAVAGRLGDRCGLVAFDREVRSVVPPRAGAAQLTRVTEAMYDLEPELVESDYRGAFATALGRFRRRSLLVLVTELAEEAVSETLIPALPLILGRHLVIVASVLDPQLTRWAEDPPTDARGAFRAAAAVAALERRSRTVARLRGLGAMVIDAPPGTLSAGLADAYLKVKATGKL
jgi:uncharacterized protein (DUF58 family)